MKKFLQYSILYAASLFLSLSFFSIDKTSEEVLDQSSDGQILPAYVQIYGPLGFYMNVDSGEMLDASRNPGNLLKENNSRQQRPVLILVSALFGRLIEPVNDLGAKYFGNRSAKTDGNYNSGYAALLSFMIINFFILWSCFYINYLNINNIFKKSQFKDAIFVGTSSFILFNGITKVYLISPHFQLFNILVPILMVYLLSMNKSNLLNAKKLGTLFLILGFGFMAYQIFILPIILLFLRSLIFFLNPENNLRNRIFMLFLCSGLTLTPFILWNGYLYIENVEYFSSSLEFQKEFIDSSGSFFINLLANAYLMFQRFVFLALNTVNGSFSLIFIFFVGMLIFLGYQSRSFKNNVFGKTSLMLILCFLMLPAFYSTSGLLDQRISDAGIYPLLLFLILLVLNFEKAKIRHSIVNNFLYVMAFINFVWIFLYFNLELFIPRSTVYLIS